MGTRFEKVIYSKYTKPEYQVNGHYIIERVDYMTVWAFKETYFISYEEGDNEKDSEILINRYEYETSKPDKGKGYRYLFKVTDLETFYKVQL